LTKPEVESSWRDRAKQMEALNQGGAGGGPATVAGLIYRLGHES
jgi:hypothetical protein